jgi:hypothetical protein
MDRSSTFVGIFGEKSVEVAKELLTNALQSEDDDSIKTEIGQRLNCLSRNAVRKRLVSLS